MHGQSVTGLQAAHTVARQGDVADLVRALRASRADTLKTFAAWEQALPDLQVPCDPTLNPPLWELGHIGWFQNFWLSRLPEPERASGPWARVQVLRLEQAPGHRPDADALYDSSRVAHTRRWQLPLPRAKTTRQEIAASLDGTLALLEQRTAADARHASGEAVRSQGLYLFRLALLHEDMHHEAALYMARALGVPVPDPRWQALALPPAPPPLHLAARTWLAGTRLAEGFAFDNECGALQARLADFEIDAQAVRWAEYLPFVESGGYDEPRWWTAAGWSWRTRHGEPTWGAGAAVRFAEASRAAACLPRYLRRDGARWWVWRQGTWGALDLSEAACHLTLHEAQAWCAWAGRRLPTEFEWECAALSRPQTFRWGDVWEWTASAFAPYPGFEPHAYRDYSAPWFDGRPVLRGASFMTQPRMRHPRYRNFFEPHRHDIAAGFRSCAA